MIYNTEIFEVSDINVFRRALESLRGAMSEAGGTELRIFRSVDDPTKVLVAMYWPDAESCRAFARDHETEVASTLRPALTSHQPEDLWEEIQTSVGAATAADRYSRRGREIGQSVLVVSEPATLSSGDECFAVDDLYALSDLVTAAWTSAADRDWSVAAGTLEWTCTTTADHAVDCVYAPAFFLASRRIDAYPNVGLQLPPGAGATPEGLVQSLELATRLLVAVVNDAAPDVRAVIFRRPELLVGAPRDFIPRGAVELILHAHDVCQGLGVPFEPPADLCYRLREHTRPWPMWTIAWRGLPRTDDPWDDLLVGSGRVNALK